MYDSFFFLVCALLVGQKENFIQDWESLSHGLIAHTTSFLRSSKKEFNGSMTANCGVIVWQQEIVILTSI